MLNWTKDAKILGWVFSEMRWCMWRKRLIFPFEYCRILVEHNQENQGNGGDLDSYLREGQWEHALQLLDRWVAEGKADNGAVEAGAPERDIYKAHPELVLWLRGQNYLDMQKQGCIRASEVYYHNSIAALYPDGVSTGSSFADTIIESLKKIKRTGSPLRWACFSL